MATSQKPALTPQQRRILDVVGRLQSVMADYLESGEPIGIRLLPVEIVSALDAAIREAEGEPSPWPDGADARTFFIHGLYQELVQQPSNMFETKMFPDGRARYMPMPRPVWIACLQMLKQTVERAAQAEHD